MRPDNNSTAAIISPAAAHLTGSPAQPEVPEYHGQADTHDEDPQENPAQVDRHE
jgi:hypothetical protein